jgi:hypothetical protein
LPRTGRGLIFVRVVVDHRIGGNSFLDCEDDGPFDYPEMIEEIVSWHGVPSSTVLDRDPRIGISVLAEL